MCKTRKRNTIFFSCYEITLKTLPLCTFYCALKLCDQNNITLHINEKKSITDELMTFSYKKKKRIFLFYLKYSKRKFL